MPNVDTVVHGGRKVPEAFECEMGDDAPIWKLYTEQATQHDEPMLRAWNSSIDTLLIFAALFSAVVTAFLVESYKLMQPDYTELTFRLLAANTSRPYEVAPFYVTASARTVNCLWITSLIASLSTSLVGILIKQWLAAYEVIGQGTPKEWSLHRQLRHDNLQRWRVPELVASLPVLLHFALFLFLAGLVVFLFPVDHATAALGLLLSAMVCILYAAATVSPLLTMTSPFRTHLTPHLFRLRDSIGRRIPVMLRSRILLSTYDRYTAPAWTLGDSAASALSWLRRSGTRDFTSDVVRALADPTHGPPAYDLLPALMQQIKNVSSSQYFTPYMTDIDPYFRVAYNCVELSRDRSSSSHFRSGLELREWYTYNYDEVDYLPVWAVGVCYLAECSHNEHAAAAYHTLEIGFSEPFSSVVAKLSVSSQTARLVIKSLIGVMPNRGLWDSEADEDRRRLETGLRRHLVLVYTWRHHFTWCDSDLGETLRTWLPWSVLIFPGLNGHGPVIPALCGILTSDTTSRAIDFRGQYYYLNDYRGMALAALLHYCMTRPRDEAMRFPQLVAVFADPRHVQYEERRGPGSMMDIDLPAWNADIAETILRASLVEAHSAHFGGMIRSFFGNIFVTGPSWHTATEAAGVRDLLVEMLLDLLPRAEARCLKDLFAQGTLQPLHTHESLIPIVAAAIKAMGSLNSFSYQAKDLQMLFPTVLCCYQSPCIPGTMCACSGCLDLVRAGARAMMRPFMEDRTEELRELCTALMSSTETVFQHEPHEERHAWKNFADQVTQEVLDAFAAATISRVEEGREAREGEPILKNFLLHMSIDPLEWPAITSL